MKKVVHRCLREHGSHLLASTTAAIKAAVMRTAEGLLCMLGAEELTGVDQFSMALRPRLAVEIEGDTMKAINDAVGAVRSGQSWCALAI